ncbi:Attractin [Liparis tanakae]|uniref:Attractin n=1 Tax=Liparis tanakae TaxID=230148 RepID=A0A4Z2F0M2_9TELE|nr:Attractin [Liparis tanakae]
MMRWDFTAAVLREGAISGGRRLVSLGAGSSLLTCASRYLCDAPVKYEPNRDLDMFINASKNFNLNITWAASFTGTQSGEEIPIVSRSSIKEFKDSFSNENFDFRNSPNITFFVYVSNFTWPIKIQRPLTGIVLIQGKKADWFNTPLEIYKWEAVCFGNMGGGGDDWNECEWDVTGRGS